MHLEASRYVQPIIYLISINVRCDITEPNSFYYDPYNILALSITSWQIHFLRE